MSRDIRDRIIDRPGTDYAQGKVSWAPVKSMWFSVNAIGGIAAVVMWPTLMNASVFMCLSIITLCGGHSLGMHRKLIHDSYGCPKWLERFGVYLGCLVGLGGPFTMIRAHDLRDWAQRQPDCHPFYSQQSDLMRDLWLQLHCRFEPLVPPKVLYPESVTRDRWMVWLQRTSVLQNVLLFGLLLALGGLGMALWGVCLRVTVSMTGHALIGWFAHNRGHRDWHKPGAAVQGHNVPWCGLVTFGESYHNNHHAYPECANLALMSGQWDPGYWVLRRLEKLGLVYDIRSDPKSSEGDIAAVPFTSH